jgi:hypothetical protein
VRDDGVGHALFTDQRGQRARVDARKRYDAAFLQPLVETSCGAIAGRIGDVGLEYRADGAGAGDRIEILDVLVIGADIADMREGEGDDLAEVGRIREDLLVAGQRRVETDLGRDSARSADALAFDDGAIGQYEERCGLFPGPSLSHASPFRRHSGVAGASCSRKMAHGHLARRCQVSLLYG